MKPTLTKYLNRQPINADTFISIGYDSDDNVLQLEFKKGKRVYNYYDVRPWSIPT